MPLRQPRPYGVGLAYRPIIKNGIVAHAGEMDVLEIPTVDHVYRHRRVTQSYHENLIREISTHYPLVAHGISMSIGSVEPHHQESLERTVKFLKQFGISEYSEHAAYHRMDGTELSLFMCMPFEDTSARWIAARYNEVVDRLGAPIGLENVSYHFPVPHVAYDESTFLRRLTELTDCFLLIDVTNVYNNAHNFGYDPIEFIRKLPGDRVKHLHLAGGHFDKTGKLVDSHDAPVMPPVWDLLRAILQYTAADVVVLERDGNFESFETIFEDVRTARRIFHEYRPVRAEDWKPWPKLPRPPVEKTEELMKEPEVQQLHRFQRAVVAILSQAEVYSDYRQKTERVAARYGLSDRWAGRLADCSREKIDELHEMYQGISEADREDEERNKRQEWAAWLRSDPRLQRMGR